MTDSHSPATKSTIMVVDDNPDLVAIVRVYLEGDGYNVRCVNSGSQAFAGLEKQKPDLILLDIMMPEMDGLEVLRRLKGGRETSSIPVILLTAKVQYTDIVTGYRMGADYYMKKPFTRTQLRTGINLFLSGDKGHSEGSQYQRLP